MLNKTDLTQVKDLIDSFQPGVTDFERDVLTPAIIDRLGYIKSICQDFQKICADKMVATHIDAAVRNLADPRLYELGVMPEPKVGGHYLSMISQQLKNDYIDVIDGFLIKYKKEEIDHNFKKLSEFYNSASNLLQTFVGLENILFHYSLRTFPNIKHIKSGKVELGAPVELSLILMPFQTRMDELLNVSKTTIESIKSWAEQIKDQKKKHIEVIVSLSQVKAAEEQSRAAKYNLIFQVVVVVFTIALVILGYWVNLYLEKRDVEKALERADTKIETCVQESVGLKENANQIGEAQKELKKQVDEMTSSQQVLSDELAKCMAKTTQTKPVTKKKKQGD